MPEQRASAVTTILFSDLVGSTELLQRVGDERARRIFQAFRRLLSEAVGTHGGDTVKWLGDGLMAVFPAVADAVRCAIAMQQVIRRPIHGERLALRVGVNVGEALADGTDYVGQSVVIARRLCDGARGGQVLCNSIVAGLVSGCKGLTFEDRGPKELKGIVGPVAVCEAVYEPCQPTSLLRHTPFVGRAAELEKLDQKLQETSSGRGALVLLSGEPGIGKTRTAREFAEAAREQGVLVLWGTCCQGEWAPPYAPFAEAIAGYARSADLGQLREALGAGAAPIARLVPALRERLPDIPEPAALQPDEESFRLLDAVSQLLIGLSARAPVTVVLDDLHWADRGTIAMLRHVARFAPMNRILLLGNYRNVEVDRSHPLAEALGAMTSETNIEQIQLEGLGPDAVGELLETISDRDVPQSLVSTISDTIGGNPFFIREVLLHLAEEGRLLHAGRWLAAVSPETTRIPEGVRQLIAHRLARLSEITNRFLTAASAFNGVFRFDLAAAAAGLDESPALQAVDEALAAQLIRTSRTADHYDFTQALVRHALYMELSPSRQLRLHRRIAEAMERAYAEHLSEHAAELAYQYVRSRELPGAERGAGHALAAAGRAEAAYAHHEAATFLRIALDLLPHSDPRRPHLLGRVGMELVWTLDGEQALRATREAGEAIAAAEGHAAAADYLAGVAMAMWSAGLQRGAWAVAAQGLSYAGDRRDGTWMRLAVNDIRRREAEDPENPGFLVDSVERREIGAVAERACLSAAELRLLAAFGFGSPKSRQEALERFGDEPERLIYAAGEYRRSLELLEPAVNRSQHEGRIADALIYWSDIVRCRVALGELAAAETAYERARALGERLVAPSPHLLGLVAAKHEILIAVDEGWKDYLRTVAPLALQPAIEHVWNLAAFWASGARLYARLGRAEEALQLLAMLIPALERGPAWGPHYAALPCYGAAALWMLSRTEHIDAIERNLRQKVLEPDFRHPMIDGRLALAQLCALQGRYEEAVAAFDRARAVLEEQEARSLRAIVDFDEGVMYLRRARQGDRRLARPLLRVALEQFRILGMRGWVRQAEQLLA